MAAQVQALGGFFAEGKQLQVVRKPLLRDDGNLAVGKLKFAAALQNVAPQPDEWYLDIAKAHGTTHVEPVAGFLNAHLHAGRADEVVFGGCSSSLHGVAQFD